MFEIVHLIIYNLIGWNVVLCGLKSRPVLLPSLKASLYHHFQILLPLLYSPLGQYVVAVLLQIVLQLFCASDDRVVSRSILLQIWTRVTRSYRRRIHHDVKKNYNLITFIKFEIL